MINPLEGSNPSPSAQNTATQPDRGVGVPNLTREHAAAFAQAGIPAGMIFVRNQNGSHNPHEAMRMEDFAAATSVMQRWAADLAGDA